MSASVAVCAAERDYDMQFWKEELVREINELEKSAAELEVSAPAPCGVHVIHELLTY